MTNRHTHRTHPPKLSRREILSTCRLVRVYVEGYDDVAFWRGVFDEFERDDLCFEVSVPPRSDLAKGKRVLLEMIPQSGPDLLLCMDSDFDYLFNRHTQQSAQVLDSPYVFHTHSYSTENLLCYAPALHRVCARATKNDTLIFDFEQFLAEYSQVIYPLFLWYAFSARERSERHFTLGDFRSSVRLNYLDLENNGRQTLNWLERQVAKRVEQLEAKHPHWIAPIETFAEELALRGVSRYNTYLFMQGHTLMDNVVMVLLHKVCDRLRELSLERITASSKQGTALRNEMSNYNNALRNVREVLLDNESFKESALYGKLRTKIEHYLETL